MNIARATISFDAKPQLVVNGQQKDFTEIEVGGKKFQGVAMGDGSYAKLKARPNGKYDVVLFRADTQDISKMSVKVNGGAVSRLRNMEKERYTTTTATVLKDEAVKFDSAFASKFTQGLTPVPSSSSKPPDRPPPPLPGQVSSSKPPDRPPPLTPPQQKATEQFFNHGRIRLHPEKGVKNIIDDITGSFDERVGAHESRKKPAEINKNGERLIGTKGNLPEERLMKAFASTIPLNNPRALKKDSNASKVLGELLQNMPPEKRKVDIFSIGLMATTGGVRVLQLPMKEMGAMAMKGDKTGLVIAAKEFRAKADNEVARFKFAGEFLTNPDTLSKLSWFERREMRALGEAYLQIAQELSDPEGTIQGACRFADEVIKDPTSLMRTYKHAATTSELNAPPQDPPTPTLQVG